MDVDVRTIREVTIYDFAPLDDGGPHRVFLYVPRGPSPASGWPLLLTTDGNATFDMSVAMMRIQAADQTGSNIEEGVIAAIGYLGEALYNSAARSWDLTPPPGARYPTERGPIRTGGAEHFLAFVEEVVLPWLSNHAAIDPRRRTLFGHSFGGLFTLFALYRRQRLFQIYAAASPSLYWENEAIKPFEDAFFAGTLATVSDFRVMLFAGEWEGGLLAPHLRRREDAPALAERLSTIAKVRRAEELLVRLVGAGSRSSLEIFAGENHMSALAVALNRAVQATFSITLESTP